MHEKNKSTDPRFRITNFPKAEKTELKKLANNAGITLTAFLRPKISTYIDSLPKELKEDNGKVSFEQICINTIPEKRKKELENISNNLKIDISALLKLELYLIAKKKK